MRSVLPAPLILVGILAVLLVAVVGICGLVNALLRRPVLNGWLWGAGVVAFHVAYHFYWVYKTHDAASREPTWPDWGEAAWFAVGLSTLLGVAAWRAVVWRRRSRRPS